METTPLMEVCIKPDSPSDTTVIPPISRRQLGVLSVALITYFNVSGGPWGSEPIIAAGGPLIGMLATFIFPWLWCLPIALIFAELFSAFPTDGSFCTWVGLAFGRSAGFQVGFYSWISGVIDNAIYPCLVVDTILVLIKDTHPIPFFGKFMARAAVTSLFTLPTLYSLPLVGRTLLLVGFLIVVPFVIMTVMSIPEVEPSNWFIVPEQIDYGTLISVLFWNYNGFDAAGAYAGEIRAPQHTFPRAMLLTVLIIGITYLIPFIAISGVNKPDFSTWMDGSYSTIAYEIGGHWLCVWIIISSIFGNLGLFIAEMTKDGFQLAGMADKGYAPEVFSKRDENHGIPRRSIALSYFVILAMGLVDFDTILGVDNFLSALACVMEIAAAVRLRFTQPTLERPFKVPVSDKGMAISMTIPFLLGIFIMISEFFKNRLTVLLNLVALCIGVFGGFLYETPRAQRYVNLNSAPGV